MSDHDLRNWLYCYILLPEFKRQTLSKDKRRENV